MENTPPIGGGDTRAGFKESNAQHTLVTADSHVTKVVLSWYDDKDRSHWQVFVQVEGGAYVKVHLTSSYYHIIYDADINAGPSIVRADARPGDIRQDVDHMGLTFGDVLLAAHDIAADMGPWVDGGYNCQSFALLLLQRLGMPAHMVVEATVRKQLPYRRALNEQSE